MADNTTKVVGAGVAGETGQGEEDVIIIDWEGPHTFDKIPDAKVKRGELDRYFLLAKHSGVYAVVGKPPVYEREQLLYIGKSERNFNEDINRDKKYYGDWNEDHLSLYFGYLAAWRGQPVLQTPEDNGLWVARLEKAAALLVIAHRPEWNCKFECSTRVVNVGTHKSLLPEFSVTHSTSPRWRDAIQKERYTRYGF